MDPIDVYRTFHPKSTQYIFFSEANRTFSKINPILGHKASLSKYKKIEITLCILSDHNSIKLGLNNKSKDKKHANSWKLLNGETRRAPVLPPDSGTTRLEKTWTTILGQITIAPWTD
jgi:hypothetical protein